MFTSDDINEIYYGDKRTGHLASFRAFVAEMNVKPMCPDCDSECVEKNMARRGEPRDMMWKCTICKTWVYQPEWVEKDLERTQEDARL